jgi:hypothetical protein
LDYKSHIFDTSKNNFIRFSLGKYEKTYPTKKKEKNGDKKKTRMKKNISFNKIFSILPPVQKYVLKIQQRDRVRSKDLLLGPFWDGKNVAQKFLLFQKVFFCWAICLFPIQFTFFFEQLLFG